MGGGCSWRGEEGRYGDNGYTEGCDAEMGWDEAVGELRKDPPEEIEAKMKR